MTDVTPETTGARVSRALREAGVTQAQAAAAINVTQGQMSRRIGGKVRITADELLAIAALCGVPAASLLGEREEAAA